MQQCFKSIYKHVFSNTHFCFEGCVGSAGSRPFAAPDLVLKFERNGFRGRVEGQSTGLQRAHWPVSPEAPAASFIKGGSDSVTPGQRVLKYFLPWFRTCFEVDPLQGSECPGGSPWVAEPRSQCSLSEAQACQGPPRQERYPIPALLSRSWSAFSSHTPPPDGQDPY